MVPLDRWSSVESLSAAWKFFIYRFRYLTDFACHENLSYVSYQPWQVPGQLQPCYGLIDPCAGQSLRLPDYRLADSGWVDYTPLSLLVSYQTDV